MGKIPIYKKPYPDELMFSWIYRMADANALSLYTFCISYMGLFSKQTISLPPDIKYGTGNLYENLNLNQKLSDFYLNLSTYPFESIWLPPGQQAKYINNTFLPADKLNSPINKLFQTLNFCPKCCNSDISSYGVPYFHRSHQLSGVKTCHKHKKMLKIFEGDFSDMNIDRYSNYSNITSDIPIDTLNAYTNYAKALFDAAPQINSKIVKDVLFRRIKELGYSVSDNYNSLISDIGKWNHNLLINYDITNFLKTKMITSLYNTAEETLPLLMFLFPSAQDFLKAIDVSIPLLIDCKCDKCGTTYCLTPNALEIGYGCPACESKYTLQERYCNYVKATDPTYIPQGEFISLNKGVPMLHRTCKKITKIKPRKFLFENNRCMCESLISVEDAKKRIEANEGFKLIQFIQTVQPVIIYSEVCGHTFQCRYNKFLSSPRCRICYPKTMTPELFAERIYTLVDDEYTIIKGFTQQNKTITLRHEVCGNIQDYKPNHFLEGFRCHHCTKLQISWERWYKLLCEYFNEFGDTNIPKRDKYHEQNLGEWAQTMRYEKKIGNLSDYQIRKMEEIDFVWNRLDYEWERKYEQYLRYIAETGQTYIPRRREYEGERLGVWVEIQRKQYKSGKMQEDRMKKLKEIDPHFFEPPK